MGLGETSGWDAVGYACVCVSMCVSAGLGAGTLRAAWGWGARESRTGLYRTCLARVGGAGWGRQEPFQVSEGEPECVRMCVSVSVSGFGGYPPHCLPYIERKRGGVGLCSLLLLNQNQVPWQEPICGLFPATLSLPY